MNGLYKLYINKYCKLDYFAVVTLPNYIRPFPTPLISIMAFPCVNHHIGFKHPFTCITIGPTMAGKTQYIANLIKHRDRVIVPNVSRVVYSYKKYQPIFDTMEGVEFMQGLPTLDKSVPTLLIIDDQMNECSPEIAELFTVGAHHDNCSIIFVSQVMFFQDKVYRTACQNATYLILFRSPRSQTQVGHLARQMFSRPKGMVEAFEDATAQPYTNLVVDCRPDTPECLRLRTNILPSEGMAFQGVHLAHAYRV